MMMVQYLIDCDARVTIPGTASPVTTFDTLEEPIALALEQEKQVAEQVSALTGIARDERDYASDQFMQWFIKEQVEEISTMSDLLTVVRRSKDDIEDIEEWVARETGSAHDDPGAPSVAGAA
jgi:ferritin